MSLFDQTFYANKNAGSHRSAKKIHLSILPIIKTLNFTFHATICVPVAKCDSPKEASHSMQEKKLATNVDEIDPCS